MRPDYHRDLVGMTMEPYPNLYTLVVIPSECSTKKKGSLDFARDDIIPLSFRASEGATSERGSIFGLPGNTRSSLIQRAFEKENSINRGLLLEFRGCYCWQQQNYYPKEQLELSNKIIFPPLK